MGAGGAGRPGVGAGGAAAGGVGRPGVGAGGAGRPGVGAGGAAAGGVGRPGVGLGGVGGPASGLGVLPGAGFGRAGTPGMYAAGAAGAAYYGSSGSGTYYASDEAMAVQAETVNEATTEYPSFSGDAVAGQPDVWVPTNLMTDSIFTKPGYNLLSAGLRLPAKPILYDYGANVIVQPSAVYVNGTTVGTPQEYAAQASQIAASGVASQPPADAKWMPLGVFAIVEGAATSSDDVFQLAVNAQGLIRGNYRNLKSGDMSALNGAVDRNSQRVAWTIGSDQYPVYEAGIGNLNNDVTTMLVHLPDGQSHQMSLIRLTGPPQ